MLHRQLSESVHSVSPDLLETVKTYLKNVCPALLFADPIGTVLIENCFESTDSHDILARFITSSESNAILVERHADDSGLLDYFTGIMENSCDNHQMSTYPLMRFVYSENVT